MKDIHRIFGIEFKGHRHDAPLPYTNVKGFKKSDDKDFPATGYSAGCQHAYQTTRPVLSEHDIFGSLFDKPNNPLYLRFQDAVLLSDVSVARYIEDFIAGYSYAVEVTTQFFDVKDHMVKAVSNAMKYGIWSIDFAHFSEQAKSALGNSLINFKVFTVEPEPGIITGDNKVNTKSIEDLEAGYRELRLTSDVEFGGYFVGEKKSITPVTTRETLTLEEMVTFRSFSLVIINCIAMVIEAAMYEQYRATQVSKVLAQIKDSNVPYGLIENVYK